MRDPGRAVDEESELASRPAGRPGFESGAARHHQGDDRGGELLAQHERAGDRDEGDRVDADVAVEEAPGGVDGERDEHDRRAQAPGRVRPARLAEQPEDRAGEERGERDDGQRALSHLYLRAVYRSASLATLRVSHSVERGLDRRAQPERRRGDACDRGAYASARLRHEHRNDELQDVRPSRGLAVVVRRRPRDDQDDRPDVRRSRGVRREPRRAGSATRSPRPRDRSRGSTRTGSTG